MIKRVISGTLPDGRLQLWTMNSDDGSFQTRWKKTASPDAEWTGWVNFDGKGRDIALGSLPDGRLQLFAVGLDGILHSRWKETANPDAEWTGWQSMDSIGISKNLQSVGVGSLPDGRLQIWVGDTTGDMWTRWKKTTNPDAEWTGWVKF